VIFFIDIFYFIFSYHLIIIVENVYIKNKG